MKAGIIDDTLEDIQVLKQYLEQYSKETNSLIEIRTFHSSIEFLECYQNDFDILFLDIEMPGTDGIETAKEIREKDSEVAIIFVTNMIQYAIRGYEVNAIDFMVKPVEYFNFTLKLEKAIHIVNQRVNQSLLIGSASDYRKIPIAEIMYIEKEKNYLAYHTTKGVFRERGTMTELRDKLSPFFFSESMTGCMVNLGFVDQVWKDEVYIGEDRLPISRRMKKQFVQDYVDYMGGNI